MYFKHFLFLISEANQAHPLNRHCRCLDCTPYPQVALHSLHGLQSSHTGTSVSSSSFMIFTAFSLPCPGIGWQSWSTHHCYKRIVLRLFVSIWVEKSCLDCRLYRWGPRVDKRPDFISGALLTPGLNQMKLHYSPK